MMARTALAALLASILTIAMVASAAAWSQMFAFREFADQYTGVESLMSAQDPAMPADGVWSAGPVAITMWDQPGGFIEGGTQKLKDGSGNWTRRPYWSYVTNSGIGGGGNWPYITLVPATYYKYTVYPSGNPNRFNIRFCYGSSFQNCVMLAQNSDMGRSNYVKVGTGGEGACTVQSKSVGCPIGYIASRENRFLWMQDGSSTWHPYCFTHSSNPNKYNNVYSDGGRVSSCGPYPQPDWTFNYR